MNKPRYDPDDVIVEVTGKNRMRFDPETVISTVVDYFPVQERETSKTPKEKADER